MKITFIISQYNRISGGNRILFEYANRLQDGGGGGGGMRCACTLWQSQQSGIELTIGQE